ncbi:MAG TPA: TorF family putative porin [Patescibacteria group bacterium]|nr:TorF family putative porin [Patescibacteria group bacterium]
MKRFVLLLLACLAGAALPLGGAVSGQVDLVSRYIWRGFDLLPENHAAIQPALTFDLGKSGLSINVWGSFALAQRGTFSYSDEIDLTLAYAFEMPGGWELSAGLIHYGYWFAEDFKFRDHTSQEVFAAVAATGLPMAPELCLYYDVNLGSGLYVTLGASHEWQVSEKLGVEVGGLVGFNSRQYIDTTGVSDIDLYARLPLKWGGLTLTPSLNVMIPLLDEVNEDTEIWFGFSAVL